MPENYSFRAPAPVFYPATAYLTQFANSHAFSVVKHCKLAPAGHVRFACRVPKKSSMSPSRKVFTALNTFVNML
jgi:hypothetical protein